MQPKLLETPAQFASSPSPQRIRRAAAFGLLACALLPPLFLFFAVQYSAITYPFWDHCELIHYFNDIHDGRFQFADLFKPHNHSRPATYRAVLIVNALLTDWDIRSEYVYLLGSIYAAFGILAVSLYRASIDHGARFAWLLLLLSIVAFSPVGQNNHWWSMMIQLDFAHLFIVAALCVIASNPRRPLNNILSAVACWLATYTLTNGLVAFVAAFAIVQLASDRIWKINRYTCFWAINLVAVLAVYLPGLPQEGTGAKPGPVDVAVFALTYLGMPLQGLIRYPYGSQFDLPARIAVGCAIGAALCCTTGYAAFRMRHLLVQTGAGRLFVVFSLFALGSAVLTAWGRATFDAQGLANANGSRYAIFSSYLLYALIFLKAGNRRLWLETAARPGRTPLVLRYATIILVIGLAANSYYRSIRVYRHSHEFNKLVAKAYSAESTEYDRLIYPNPDSVKYFKASLRRLQLGPYANQ